MRDFVEVCLPNNYPHQFLATDSDFAAGVADPGYSDPLRRAPLIRKGIERKFAFWISEFRFFRSAISPSRRLQRAGGRHPQFAINERFRYRNFVDAVLGERNTNRVANSVRQQRTNANRALDPGVFPFARFGHPKVNRVIPVWAFFIQSRRQQPICRNHHLGIARFHREHECVVIQIACDPRKLKGAFHHPERRIAVAV